jgi:hypothetical protein
MLYDVCIVVTPKCLYRCRKVIYFFSKWGKLMGGNATVFGKMEKEIYRNYGSGRFL